MRLTSPVLVTGVPRSGKSLISKVLSESTHLSWVREPKESWQLQSGPVDDCWRATDVTDVDVNLINKACAERLPSLPDSRYLDDLSLHCLRLEATLKIVPDARVIFAIRDPAQVIPELTSYWKGLNARYAVGNRVDKGIRLLDVPKLGAKFLRNRIAIMFFGRVYYVGPEIEAVMKLPLSMSAVAMAAQQIDSMLTHATSGFDLIPRSSIIQVDYESFISCSGALLEEIADHCGVSSRADSILKAADEIVESSHIPRHWLDLSAEEKKIAEPVVEKWRGVFGFK